MGAHSARNGGAALVPTASFSAAQGRALSTAIAAEPATSRSTVMPKDDFAVTTAVESER